jgi:hypothetical protein
VRRAALFAAVLLLLVAKEPLLLLLPALHAEDGSEVLAVYYRERDPAWLLRAYQGYVALLPNLIGYAACSAPVAWVPTLLAALPMLFAAAAFCIPAWLPASAPRPGDRARRALVLLLAALPLGSATLVANTTYSMWNALLALALLAAVPFPRRPGPAAALVAVSALLLWSHPLSLAALPVYAVRLALAARGRRAAEAAAWLALLAAGTAYQGWAVSREGVALRAVTREAYVTARALAERVAFEAVLGPQPRSALQESAPGAVTAAGAALALGLAALVAGRARRDAEARPALLCLSYYAVALTAGAVAGRQLRAGILASPDGVRYFYVPKVLFWVLAGAVVGPALARLAPRARRALAAAAVAGILALAWANRDYYATSAGEGARVQDLVRRAALAEARNGGRRGIRETLERGAWTIRLEAP